MDQLWVPILSHYRDGKVDKARTAAHLAAIRGEVSSILLAGSTGDGWDVDDAAFGDLLALLRDPHAFPAGTSVMIGALRDTTENVLTRIVQILGAVSSGNIAADIFGLAVCPPIDADIDQAGILRHYEAVLEASPWPISVYQLPQVTRCTIQPETLSRLAEHPKVVMFKDSSGADLVALSGAEFGKVKLVRGAEGGYAGHLKPAGRYDGWLLSTGNAFARPLREVLRLLAAGDTAAANALSDRLTGGVEALFAEAAKVPFSNAFSNANRAADHILAYGAGWREAEAPATVTGQRLLHAVLDVADKVVGDLVGVPAKGYLAAK